MPELPDLQAFSHNLNKTLHGKKVAKVTSSAKKLNVSETELNEALTGKTVKAVVRNGKELNIQFSGGQVLGLHLMLHGKLFLFDDENRNKNTVLEITFTDKSGLALTDFQKMATPTLNPEESAAPDALEMDADKLKQALGKSKAGIKAVLLNQHIVRGIGNAYADEILWHARISPFSQSSKIPPEKIEDLAKSIKEVLTQAEKHILKTHPDIINGEVRDFMLIHNSKAKQSPDGADIKVEAGTRKTYYTDEQVLYK
jgi:formamidopyrimidine-DNA glycosylase